MPRPRSLPPIQHGAEQPARQPSPVPTLNVHVVDAYQLIDNAVADPAAYGLTNVTSPVWSGNYTSASSGTLAATGAAAQDQYLFWDHLHPTETGHQQIAAAAEVELSGSAATSQITQFYNNILQRAPDPAGLPVLGYGRGQWCADAGTG